MIDVPARVKDALRRGSYKKEYRIIAYQNDGETVDFVIDNNDLVYESVTIDERMCSGSELKFGLCEGSSLEFQYMPSHKVETLETGMNLKDMPFSMKEGFPRPTTQEFLFDTTDGHLYYTDRGMMSYFTIYVSDGDEATPWAAMTIEDFPFYFAYEDCIIQDVNSGNSLLPYLLFEPYTVNKSLEKGRRLQVIIDVEYKNENGELDIYPIPMGWFTVDSISRQASTGINKITAYNKLRSTYLDQPVNGEIENILNQAGSQGMQVFRLLQILLSDYGMDGFTEIPLQYKYSDLPSSIGTVRAFGIPTANGNNRVYNGNRITVYGLYIPLPLQGEYDSNYYYRFIINTTQSWYRRFASSYANSYESFLQTDVWCEETQTKMTLSYYMQHGYAYSGYFGGFLLYTQNNTPHEHGLYFPPSNVDTGFLSNLANLSATEHAVLSLFVPVRIQNASVPNPSMDVPAGIYPANMNMDHTITSEISTAVRNNASNLYKYTKLQRQLPETSYSQDISGIATQVLYASDIEAINENITLREIQSAVFEINCQYGKLDRETDLFCGVNLNNSKLMPRATTPVTHLYPSNTLYPDGAADRGYKAMYSKLWADENNVIIFRYLEAKYMGTEVIDGQTKVVEKTYLAPINTYGNTDYLMYDNWLLKNLVWNDSDIGAYLGPMADKLKSIKQFPFEMWCAGLPYIEPGDELEIDLNEQSYQTYVLRRTLNGIQNLEDTMINGTLDIF